MNWKHNHDFVTETRNVTRTLTALLMILFYFLSLNHCGILSYTFPWCNEHFFIECTLSLPNEFNNTGPRIKNEIFFFSTELPNMPLKARTHLGTYFRLSPNHLLSFMIVHCCCALLPMLLLSLKYNPLLFFFEIILFEIFRLTDCEPLSIVIYIYIYL